MLVVAGGKQTKFNSWKKPSDSGANTNGKPALSWTPLVSCVSKPNSQTVWDTLVIIATPAAVPAAEAKSHLDPPR